MDEKDRLHSPIDRRTFIGITGGLAAGLASEILTPKRTKVFGQQFTTRESGLAVPQQNGRLDTAPTNPNTIEADSPQQEKQKAIDAFKSGNLSLPELTTTLVDLIQNSYGIECHPVTEDFGGREAFIYASYLNVFPLYINEGLGPDKFKNLTTGKQLILVINSEGRTTDRKLFQDFNPQAPKTSFTHVNTDGPQIVNIPVTSDSPTKDNWDAIDGFCDMISGHELGHVLTFRGIDPKDYPHNLNTVNQIMRLQDELGYTIMTPMQERTNKYLWDLLYNWPGLESIKNGSVSLSWILPTNPLTEGAAEDLHLYVTDKERLAQFPMHYASAERTAREIRGDSPLPPADYVPSELVGIGH